MKQFVPLTQVSAHQALPLRSHLIFICYQSIFNS